MSKIPLWVYNYELKRHEVFPHHLLTNNPNGDGSVGLYVTWNDREKMSVLQKYWNYFDGGTPINYPQNSTLGYLTVVSTAQPGSHTFYVLKQREEK